MCLVVSLRHHLHVAVSISAIGIISQLLTIGCSLANEQTLPLLRQGRAANTSRDVSDVLHCTTRTAAENISMRQETDGIGVANQILGADQQLSQRTSKLGQKFSTFVSDIKTA